MKIEIEPTGTPLDAIPRGAVISTESGCIAIRTDEEMFPVCVLHDPVNADDMTGILLPASLIKGWVWHVIGELNVDPETGA
jgi:hypothetical protein